MARGIPLPIPEPGTRFGRLTVLSQEIVRVTRYRRRAVRCQCDCGIETAVVIAWLLRPDHRATRSCGCLFLEERPQALARGRASEAMAEWITSDANRAKGRGQAEANGWVKHGLYQHPLYIVWQDMIERCEHPSTNGYHRWGGRGITVCERWHDIRLFIEDIEATIGPRPEGRNGKMPLYTLDRMDNNGHYVPGNVRWATQKQQAANQRPRSEWGGPRE